MKHTIRISHIISFLLMICTLFAACQEDKVTSVTQDSATQQVWDQGILNLGWESTSTTLLLNKLDGVWEFDLQSSGEDNAEVWVKLSTDEGDTGYTIRLQAQKNKGIEPRQTLLTLTNGRISKTIIILQRPQPQMKVDMDHIDATGDKGQILVSLHTNVLPAIDSTTIPSWLHLKEVKHVNNQKHHAHSAHLLFIFDADANKALGRTCTLVFKSKEGSTAQATIHQWPQQLDEAQTIHVEEPGTLGTLLGGDASKWAGIVSLTLTGSLNNTDMQALRLLLGECVGFQHSTTQYDPNTGHATHITHSYTVYLRVKHLDMSRCTLVAGGSDYAEPTIEKAGIKHYAAYQNNTLGASAFELIRMPLESIQLPSGLQTIGANAFVYSYHLKEINIPASVTTIEHNAFFNCQALTRINIPADSKLRHIGDRAFDTSSMLDEIRIPASVIVEENGSGLLGAPHTLNIHVSWTVPPILNRRKIAKTRTLYVPRGCGNAYRKAPGWSNAKEIIEEEE